METIGLSQQLSIKPLQTTNRKRSAQFSDVNMYFTQFRRILCVSIILTVHLFDGVESSPSLISSLKGVVKRLWNIPNLAIVQPATSAIHRGYTRAVQKVSAHQTELTKQLCSFNTVKCWHKISMHAI